MPKNIKKNNKKKNGSKNNIKSAAKSSRKSSSVAKGGAYNYEPANEWLNRSNRLGNIDLLEKIEKGNRKGVMTESDKTGVETLFDLGAVNAVDQTLYNSNSNSKEITKAINTLRGSEPLIEKLSDLKTKLNADIRAIKNKDTSSLDVNSITSSIRKGSPLIGYDIVNKTVTNKPGDLSNPEFAAEKIIEYARKQLEDIRGSESNAVEEDWGMIRLDNSQNIVQRTELKEALGKDEASIRFCIESMLGWKNVDLEKWAVGTVNDFIEFVMILACTEKNLKWSDDDGKGKGKWVLDWFTKMCQAFYPESEGGFDGLQAYIRSNLEINGLFNGKLKDYMFESDTTDKVKKMDASDLNKVIQVIFDAIETQDDKKLTHRKEFLVVLIYWLFAHAINEMKKFVKVMEAAKFKGKKGLEESVKGIELLYKNAIAKFFDIDIKMKGSYGILEKGGTKDKIAKYDRYAKEWVFRVLGGEASIRAVTKFNNKTYPIVLKSNDLIDKAESKKRLTKLLLSAKDDFHTGKPITVGGIIPKEKIARAAIMLTKRFLGNNLGVKQKNVRRINAMMTKMRSKLHVQYLIDTKNRMRRLYGKIADDYDVAFKDKTAKAVIEEIIENYEKLKRVEKDRIVAIYRILKVVQEEKGELGKNVDAIDKLRVQKERILVELNQSQLKTMAYRLIALNLYKMMQIEYRSDFNRARLEEAEREAELTMGKVSKDRLPTKYYELLEARFDKVNREYNSDISGFIRGKKELDEIRTKLILGALGSNKVYHVEFWNKIFGNGLDDIDEDEEEEGRDENPMNVAGNAFVESVSGDGNGKGKNVNSSGLREMNNSNFSNVDKKIVRQKFWLDIRKKLDGKTIYIPFIHTRTVLKDKYGLFDLVESCIRGRITSDMLIYQGDLDVIQLGQVIRPRGTVMVCGTEDNKDRPSRWRVMLKEELDMFAKLNESDIRLHFYRTLADRAVYNKRANLYWHDPGNTGGKRDTDSLREHILHYCRTLKGYQECPIITSRDEVAAKLNGVDGIEFEKADISNKLF